MNIQDGTYPAKPVGGSIYETKTGNLTLVVEFVLTDDNGEAYTNPDGTDCIMRKWFTLVTADGSVNSNVISRVCEWAEGFQPNSLDDFYDYFTGDCEKLKSLSVDVVLRTEPARDGSGKMFQGIAFVNAKRRRSSNRIPEGAIGDKDKLAAKFGSKFRAVFGSKPKTVSAKPAPKKPTPEKPEAAPAAKKATSSCDECWQKYLSSLPAGTDNDTRDGGWFALLDKCGVGQKDQDEIDANEWGTVLAAIG